MWHLSTQSNDGIIASYITVFDPSSVKCRRFITFLVHAMVYLSNASNLVALANQILGMNLSKKTPVLPYLGSPY